MPPILSKPSASARMAVIYVTLGTLIDVWTVIWYLYLNHHNAPDTPYFWCYGFFFTGLALIIIGLALGRIGRAARHDELPPEVSPSAPTAQPAVTAPARGVPQVGAPLMMNPGNAGLGGAVVPPVAPVAPVAPPGPQSRVGG